MKSRLNLAAEVISVAFVLQASYHLQDNGLLLRGEVRYIDYGLVAVAADKAVEGDIENLCKLNDML